MKVFLTLFHAIGILTIALGIFSLGWVIYQYAFPSIQPPVACTEDARMCPDGSSVGREGPLCEFANCPTEEKKVGGKSDSEWKSILTSAQYSVLKQKGTEIPFTGELLYERRAGTYVTADCGTPVFRSEAKYDSHTGWPSFYAPIEGGVTLVNDKSEGLERTEVIDSKCGSHLGHVFDDGPEPTGKRFCINSVALKFIPD